MSAGPDPNLAGIAGFQSIARIASRGNRLATLVSAFAFAFSAVSFYETVSETIEPARIRHRHPVLYPRPLRQLRGGRGADHDIEQRRARWRRDHARTRRQKRGNRQERGVFASAYTVDAQYFAGNDDVTRRLKRPKMPFAPLSIAGQYRLRGHRSCSMPPKAESRS